MKKLVSIFAILSLVFSIPVPVFAGGPPSSVWVGGGTDDYWSTSDNWSSAPVDGNTLVFTGTTRLTPDNDLDPLSFTVAGILYTGVADPRGDAGAFTLSGNAITLSGTIDNESTNLQTINLDMDCAIDLQLAAVSGDITIGGIISGAGGISVVGNGIATLTGDNTYTGATTIETGSTLNLNKSLTTSSGLVFRGDGTVNVAAGKNIGVAVTNTFGGPAGTLIYLGNSTTGGTIGATGDEALKEVRVSSGTLSLGHNVFATNTNINDGGAANLSADVAIEGNVTLAGTSSLTLGANKLTLSGTYTQDAADQVLNITIDGATYGKIDATATGTAAFSAGEVKVAVGGSSIANGTEFTIFDASAGAVTVDDITVTVVDSTAISFTISSTGDDLILTAVVSDSGTTYAETATDGNGEAVGAVLDDIKGTGATGDMLSVLNTLDGLSASELGNALDTMTPDVSSGAAEASRGLTNQGFTMISNRLGGARSGLGGTGISSGDTLDGVGVWIQGLGSHLKQDERKGIEGYKANMFGTTIGADKLIDRHFRAGLAGSYGFADVNSKTPGSPSDDINSYQATVYGSYDSLDLCEARKNGKNSREAVRNQNENLWYVDGMAAFTQNDYDSRREIWLTPTTHRVAKADHAAQQYSTNFEAGYTFVFGDKKEAVELTPFVSLGYSYLYMNKYKEKGADALNLTVDGEGFHQLLQALGTKLAYPIVSEKAGTFIPSVKAAWLYDYIGDRFETTASFAGGGPSFNTQGAKPAKNGMLFGAELAFLNKGNMTVTGNWDIELKDQFMSNTYYGTLRYDF